MTALTLNKELNGIEISFESKPSTATLDALKAAGYRWHRAKKVWYAKQTAERLALAQEITGGQVTQPAPIKAAKAEIINLDNLGATKPASLHGAELAKAIREDLKKRGVKGVTVRARKVTHDTGITVTVKAEPSDILSIEEMKERYPLNIFKCEVEEWGRYTGERWLYSLEGMTDEEIETEYNKHITYYTKREPATTKIHHYNNKRDDYFTVTTAFYNKLVAVEKIANQWNWDNSDIMTDYFDIGYFLDIDVKIPEGLELREKMTAEERTALEAERAAEAAERAAALERYKKEEEERERASQEAEKIRQAQRETIANGSKVADLDESEQIYITNLHGGAGKEASLEELNESITTGYCSTFDAQIVRRVDMTSEAFAAFCELFLDDFEFLAGMGGTGSEDIRLEGVKNIYQLNQDQRDAVKWYICNAVGIYVDNELKLVCDPQGHNYSRYTYIPTEESEITSATDTAEKQRTESETKPAFYFPQSVEEQAQNISTGEAITIYKCDGWNLHSIYAGAGVVEEVTPGEYAQYSNGVWITFTDKKKKKQVFIHNGEKCLIYKGIKPALPESVTRRQINPRMYELLNYNELLTNAYNYYLTAGEHPIIDTIQR